MRCSLDRKPKGWSGCLMKDDLQGCLWCSIHLDELVTILMIQLGVD